MPLLAMLAGAVLGGMVGHGIDAIVAGSFIALIAGLVVHSWRKSRAAPRSAAAAGPVADADDPLALLDPRVAERLRTMERRIATLEAAARGTLGENAAAEAAVPAATPPAGPVHPVYETFPAETQSSARAE